MINSFKPHRKLRVEWVSDEIGWGVFTEEPIFSGETVEYCYGLLDNIHTSPYRDYVFQPDKLSTDVYHLLGYGAIYNHSDNSNIGYRLIDKERRIVEFFALRDIDVEEELRHNYGKGYWESRKKKQLI